MKYLVRKEGFSRADVKVVTSDLRGSTAAFCQGKWFRFLYWCCGWNLSLFKAIVQQIAEFFLYLCQDLKLLVPLVKGYHAALNHVFSLAEVDLAANTVISQKVSFLFALALAKSDSELNCLSLPNYRLKEEGVP